MTAGQLRRRKRDIVILAAWSRGISQRHLAEVFGLPHSRIVTILKSFRAEAGRAEDRRQTGDPTYRDAFRQHPDGRKRERSNPACK
jgi:hypothetical protein